MADETALLLTLSADIRRFERAMERAAGTADRRLNEVERRAREADKKLKEFGSEIGTGLGKASAAAAVALGGIGLYAVELAKDAAETKNAFQVAFKDSAAAAEAFANTLADKVGRDVVELQGKMSQLRLIMDGLGVSGEQSLTAIQRLSERAIDIGSLFNVSDAEAFQAIISGISGEAEPLKKFGVVLNDTALQAELLRLGFKGTAQEASESAKAIARTNIILERTKVAQGDAANTADSLANQQKRARAEFDAAARKLGEALIPAMTQATQAAANLATAIGDMPTSMQVAGLAMLALVAAGGPIATLIAGFVKLRAAAIAAAAASAAASGAGGAAGGAAAGAGAGAAAGVGARVAAGARVGGLVGAAVVGAGAVIYNDRNRNQRKADRTQALRDPSKVSLERLEAAAGLEMLDVSPRQRRTFAADQKRLKDAIAARKQQRAQLSADIALTFGPTAPGGSLTLDAGQLAPVGGGTGGKKGPKGPSAETLAKRAAAAAEKAAREAEQRAQEQRQRERDLDDALMSVASRELSAREAGATTAEERYALSRERMGLDRVALEEERRRAVQDGKLTQAQADRLNALDAEAEVIEDRNNLAELNRALEERALRAQEEVYRLAADALGVEAAMATTLTQRAEVERRILALAQQEERDRLERQIAAGEVASPDAARYNLRTNQAGQRAAQEANPLGRGPLDAGADAIAGGILDQDGAAARFEAENKRIAELQRQGVLDHEQAERAKAQISAAYNEQRLANTQSFFGALAGLQESGNAKLRAIGKAAAIAQATIDGVLAVQKALASAPPPFNFAIAAAVGASAALNVAKIAGFERGGYTGPGGRREVAGVVHGREFVVDADNTAKYRAELEHLQRTGKLPGYANGGFVMPRAPVLPDMGRIAAVGSSRSATVLQSFDLRGAVMTDDLLQEMDARSERAARAAFAASRYQVPQDLRARQRKLIPSAA